MNETLIKVEKASKKFCRTLKHSMFYGVSDLAGSFFSVNKEINELRQNEFWALADASFELKRGECLGLIGPNGSGKSTLLKMLNGIFMPDKGSIEINGCVGALIEVGAGFHPMLTGRENVYINGSILGLSKKEIDKRFDEIVDFAELEDFIDSPVKHYSSGMHVRLGFAIAAQIKPDILLIDEVLAVGDVGFRAKCYNYIATVMKNSTIIFVSHSIPQISRMCTKVGVINKGRIICYDDPSIAINDYYRIFAEEEEPSVTGNGRASIQSIKLLNGNGADASVFEYGEPMSIEFIISVDPSVHSPIIHFGILNKELQVVAQCYNFKHEIINDSKLLNVFVSFDKTQLAPGKYSLSVIVFDEKQREHMTWHQAVNKFEIKSSNLHHLGSPIFLAGNWTSRKES